MRDNDSQYASDLAAASRTGQALVAAQGLGKRIVILKIVATCPIGASLLLDLKAGTTQFYPRISLNTTMTSPVYDSGPMYIKLPENTALNFDTTASSTGSVFVIWKMV